MSDPQTTKKPLKLKSDFAILDVKNGRKALKKALADPKQPAIPVTITGFLTRPWGDDDGTSIEFEMQVETVVLT